VIQHPDCTVLHETFADPFYFGPDAKPREGGGDAEAALEASSMARDKTYAGVCDKIVGGGTSEKPQVFTKELSTFWQRDKLPHDQMARFKVRLDEE